jgi:predicted Zn-dependent protease
MTNRKALSVIAVLLAFIMLPLSCAINPVTGKRELMLVTQQDELALGKQSDVEIGRVYGFYENKAVSDYVNRIGQSIARNTHQPNMEYHFKVLDTPIINAFAVPGGYVYVTRGILAYMNDEAELAGVIGHELGHVNARHIARQMTKQQLTILGLNVGMALSKTIQEYAGLAQFGVSILFLKFSRDDERQADNLGVEYSSKTGYDSNRMAAFFETLERLSPESGASLPEWFSTHPNPVNRVAAVQAKTAEWQKTLNKAQYAVNRNEYLKAIDGIVFGDDPRQGYAEGSAFYHPTLRFTFPVPSGWKVNNTPAQVQMVSEKQDAAIILLAGNEKSVSAAADTFIQRAKAAVKSREKITVNGLQAEKIVARVISDEDTLQVMSCFIAKGGTIYTFHGLTGWQHYSRYSNEFSNTMSGFKNLDDASKINVKPELLHVKTVTKAGNLSSALKQLGTSDADLEQRTILNGMKGTDNVSVGTLLKIVSK